MSTSTSPAPATGSPRAMSEQGILRIIWPPDGRPTWEDRHKIPRIEQALGTLLDIVEGDDVKPAAIKARESQKLTAQILDLRQQGLTMAQVAEVTGLTEYAVIHRISNSKKTQNTNARGAPVGQEGPNSPRDVPQSAMVTWANPEDLKALQGEPVPPAGITATDLPAALRIAAPDQSVGANKMIAGTDSADGVDYEVLAAQPEVEQVPGLQQLQEEKPERSEKPRDPEQKQYSKTKKVPLTDSQKAQILDLHARGVNNHDIAAQLGIKDTRQVQGCIIARRKTAENVPAVQSRGTPVPSTKDVMLLPSNVADTSPAAPKPTEGKPAPKAMSRAETDEKMWDLWKSGKSPKEIADILWDEELYYSEKSVTVRLRSQGADL